MSRDSEKRSGKVALVTSGLRGIGAAIVSRLAREGAVVAFTYSASRAKAEELVRQIQDAGGKAFAIRADSTDAVAVQDAVRKTVEAHGKLDLFVNNAAIMRVGAVDQVSLEDLDAMLAVNVRSVYVECRMPCAT